ncbi:MAG TPA: RES family NAD+ phosphorylase [Alphaproteobacteria bacterium]|nr:RES family NAD+ phosphorylase [Alphaproteobacteria bacterium]
MPPALRKARDLALLDAIDAFKRETFAGAVWRVTREGRDPLLGARSRSRWCNDSFDVLYTSTERDGALAEIHALLSSQPVFPSRLRARVHRIAVRASKLLRIDSLAILAELGVDTSRYRERRYERTQEIADAAYFLGFGGLIAPSARWKCASLVLFTDRIPPADLRLEASERKPIDWQAWKRAQAGAGEG